MFNQDELAFISLFLFCSMPKLSSFLLALQNQIKVVLRNTKNAVNSAPIFRLKAGTINYCLPVLLLALPASQTKQIVDFFLQKTQKSWWAENISETGKQMLKSDKNHLNRKSTSTMQLCYCIKPVFFACWITSGDKNSSILYLPCRTSYLQFSIVMQTHVLVL